MANAGASTAEERVPAVAVASAIPSRRGNEDILVFMGAWVFERGRIEQITKEGQPAPGNRRCWGRRPRCGPGSRTGGPSGPALPLRSASPPGLKPSLHCRAPSAGVGLLRQSYPRLLAEASADRSAAQKHQSAESSAKAGGPALPQTVPLRGQAQGDRRGSSNHRGDRRCEPGDRSHDPLRRQWVAFISVGRIIVSLGEKGPPVGN